MTQRQRAIEEIVQREVEKVVRIWDISPFSERPTKDLCLRLTDALLASDFCSDSVRELVKHLVIRQGDLSETEEELLRKIVSD